MKIDAPQVLSMLIDGETVDPDSLLEALSEGGAAQTLRSFAELRVAVAADTTGPSAAVAAAIAQAQARPSKVAWLRRPLTSAVPAAMVGAAAAAAALLVFRPATPSPVIAQADAPPRPELVVRFALDQQP